MNWTRLPDREGDPGRYYRLDGVYDDPDPQIELHCFVPEDAIDDRKILYSVTTEDDAILHIMWEHHLRHNPKMTPQAAGMPANVKANFDRVHGPGHKPLRGMAMTREEWATHAARHRAIYNAARGPRHRPGGR